MSYNWILLYKTYSNIISKEICEHFIDVFEKEDKLGNTSAGTSGGEIRKDWKDATDFLLRPDITNLVDVVMYDEYDKNSKTKI